MRDISVEKAFTKRLAIFTDADEDIHICGLCKTTFTDVELFLQHKKYNCPIRLARQREEEQKTVEGLKDIANVPYENNAVEPTGKMVVAHNAGLLPVKDIQLRTGSNYVRPVELFVNKSSQGFQSVASKNTGALGNGSSIDVLHERQPNYNTEECQTDSESHVTLHTTDGHEYVFITNGQDINHYDNHGQPLEAIKKYNVNQANYLLEPHGVHTELQTTPVIQEVKQSVYLQNKGHVSQDLVSQTSQLPVFISKEIIQNDRLIQSSPEDNLSLQIQRRLESNLNDSEGIKYSLTFENSGHLTNQNASTSNVSNVLISPKVNNQPKSKKEVVGKRTPSKTQAKSKLETVAGETKTKKTLEKKYVCQQCPYKTAYLKDLERHTRIHTGERPFKCGQCVKTFNRSDKLVLHMKYHQDERAFKCDLCEYRAVEKSSLKKHMKTHLDERPYGCQVCPYKARSSSQLQVHLRIHTGDTPYQCKKCGHYFKVKSDLKRHMRTHTGEKPYSCPEPDCAYRCSIRSNLRSHMKTNHRVDVKLTCDICEYTTSSKRALFEHKKVHEVNTDLKCTVCAYQCSNRSALRNHLRRHRGERTKCNYCSYSSFQNGNVQAHMKRRHNLKIGKAKSGRIGDNDLKRSGLENLNEENHGGLVKSSVRTKCQQNYKCNQCEAAFVREDSLRCHLKEHSDSPLSTAYAVLKLQNPVINTSTSTNLTESVQSVTAQVDGQQQLSQSESRHKNPPTEKYSSQVIVHQDRVIQNQASTLGINNILAAARLSGLTSCGNSPTLKKPLEQFVYQDGSDTATSVTLTTPSGKSDDQVITLSQQQQQPDLSTVQVMQDVSLPYMRLPNGQILILTGQNSVSSVIQHSNSVTHEQTPINHGAAFQTQIIAQQPTTEQQQIIQIPENSNSSSVPTISTPQSGAIPIQIILPNDSQQPIPLVSQLLNSVINKGTSEVVGGGILGQTTTAGGGNCDEQIGDGTQKFVVQIPAQSGTLMDPSAGMAESQSFVLQIPGTENFS